MKHLPSSYFLILLASLSVCEIGRAGLDVVAVHGKADHRSADEVKPDTLITTGESESAAILKNGENHKFKIAEDAKVKLLKTFSFETGPIDKATFLELQQGAVAFSVNWTSKRASPAVIKLNDKRSLLIKEGTGLVLKDSVTGNSWIVAKSARTTLLDTTLRLKWEGIEPETTVYLTDDLRHSPAQTFEWTKEIIWDFENADVPLIRNWANTRGQRLREMQEKRNLLDKKSFVPIPDRELAFTVDLYNELSIKARAARLQRERQERELQKQDTPAYFKKQAEDFCRQLETQKNPSRCLVYEGECPSGMATTSKFAHAKSGKVFFACQL